MYNHTIFDKKINDSVEQFSSYVDEIESCVINFDKNDKRISKILNGETAIALNRIIPASIRKNSGIFFTGPYLSEKVAKRIQPILNEGASLIDPACGAGDLLTACAQYLPREKTLRGTIRSWSKLISGYDLHEQFIRATRLRLILLAANLHCRDFKLQSIISETNFSNIQVNDSLSPFSSITHTDCIVTNPPFGHMIAPDDCTWSSGKVQVAGVFFEKLLKSAHRGQHIIAILPDVLRSGTRYQKWRKLVADLSESLYIELMGRFDNKTDIDVFLLYVIAGKRKDVHWPCLSNSKWKNSQRIKDLFDVHVGPVVPHRHQHKGPWHSYIDSSSALPWEVVTDLPNRRFYGTTFKSPFVVVRRTSSPSDNNRATATVVRVPKSVAVENHLIILKPKDNTIKLCNVLLKQLKDNRTNRWLNRRIRCRHLTVTSIKELPWWDLDETKT